MPPKKLANPRDSSAPHRDSFQAPEFCPQASGIDAEARKMTCGVPEMVPQARRFFLAHSRLPRKHRRWIRDLPTFAGAHKRSVREAPVEGPKRPGFFRVPRTGYGPWNGTASCAIRSLRPCPKAVRDSHGPRRGGRVVRHVEQYDRERGCKDAVPGPPSQGARTASSTTSPAEESRRSFPW